MIFNTIIANLIKISINNKLEKMKFVTLALAFGISAVMGLRLNHMDTTQEMTKLWAKCDNSPKDGNISGAVEYRCTNQKLFKISKQEETPEQKAELDKIHANLPAATLEDAIAMTSACDDQGNGNGLVDGQDELECIQDQFRQAGQLLD